MCILFEGKLNAFSILTHPKMSWKGCSQQDNCVQKEYLMKYCNLNPY